ncbi:MAG: diaminobutyrate acetyltransferase [Acidimicrobiales bacterium]
MTLDDLTLTAPTPGDGAAMWRVAQEVGLDPNSPYKYLVFCRDFATSSVVARAGGDTVGFVTGYRRVDAPDTLFVWQVGVRPVARRHGVAAAMLDHLVAPPAGAGPGTGHLEATVTPQNSASLQLFTAFAERHGAPLRRSVLFPAALFPEPHDDEVLLRIGPL